jgi:hypothetical protein
VKYYFSGQYMDQSSNFRNSIEHYKQYNFRSNIDARISKKPEGEPGPGRKGGRPHLSYL